MKSVKAFVLSGCPYCRNAMKAWDELTAAPEYSDVRIDWINENQYPEIARSYDYYYCPTMFVDDEKVYEAHPDEQYEETKKNVEKVLMKAVE